MSSVFAGTAPARAGQVGVVEMQGMASVGEDRRYGSSARMVAVWAGGNLELSTLYIGALAASLGLGFGLGAAAITAGTILGTIPVAALATWGPRTGAGQIPLARMPFGRFIPVPALIQVITAIGWVALVSLFGAEAAQSLTHWPFWACALLVIGVQCVIAIWGHEALQKTEQAGAVIMTVLFAVLTVKIAGAHAVLPHTSVHGADLAGAFVLMITISMSGPFSWASYASDLSRYLPSDVSPARVFAGVMTGMIASCLWVELLGLAAAGALGSQTAAGVRSLMGGGWLGAIALVGVMIGAVTSGGINAYSASLAAQAAWVRLWRPVIACLALVLAFALTWWLQAASTAARFTNVLLFTAYWIAALLPVVIIDWQRNRARYTPALLNNALSYRTLPAGGWRALAAFAAGFAAMLPFMDTSLYEGPVAHILHGADVAFAAGFAVTWIVYQILLRWVPLCRRAPSGATAAEIQPMAR